MALEIFTRDDDPVLLAAYEDGRLAMFTSTRPAKWSDARRDEGEGWELRWYAKGHREPSALSMLS
jgi:hypothetical protein